MSTAAAAPPSRFTFDLDLGRREERTRVMSDGAIADLVRKARLEGFAEGFAQGEGGTAAISAKRISDAAERLADRASGMIHALDEARATTVSEAAELALTIGRRLALHLIARQPAAELEALIEECLSSLEGTPHLVVRCHPELAEAIRATAEGRMAVSGFSGKLVVIADPDLAISDGRIEWADGGVVRDMGRVSAQIDRAIADFLNTNGAARAAEQTQK
jgi:flagellar assembly protein FliH